jgi:hypothetical protein
VVKMKDVIDELRHLAFSFLVVAENKNSDGLSFKELNNKIWFVSRFNKSIIECVIRDMLYDNTIVPDRRWNLRLVWGKL